MTKQECQVWLIERVLRTVERLFGELEAMFEEEEKEMPASLAMAQAAAEDVSFHMRAAQMKGEGRK
jgi:hypothetical protein